MQVVSLSEEVGFLSTTLTIMKILVRYFQYPTLFSVKYDKITIMVENGHYLHPKNTDVDSTQSGIHVVHILPLIKLQCASINSQYVIKLQKKFYLVELSLFCFLLRNNFKLLFNYF